MLPRPGADSMVSLSIPSSASQFSMYRHSSVSLPVGMKPVLTVGMRTMSCSSFTISSRISSTWSSMSFRSGIRRPPVARQYCQWRRDHLRGPPRIRHSRAAWNPNPGPRLALLTAKRISHTLWKMVSLISRRILVTHRISLAPRIGSTLQHTGLRVAGDDTV